jgi:hypothetical protein
MVTRLDKAGVVSSGSTTERTLEDRFSEVVNIKDFGAVGDGVTDDSAAILSAIEYAETIWDDDDEDINGRATALYFPPGVYECNNTQFPLGVSVQYWQTPARSTVYGAGPATSIIKNGGFQYFATGIEGAEIFNLGFYGPGKENDSDTQFSLSSNYSFPGNIGINLDDGYESVHQWTNTTIPPSAIEIGLYARYIVIHNIAIDNYYIGIYDTSTGSAGTRRITELDIRNCGTGIYQTSSELYLSDFMIKSCDGPGIHIIADEHNRRIENCQIMNGEVHTCAVGLKLEQSLCKDYRKLGRYTKNYLPPPSSGWTYDPTGGDPPGSTPWILKNWQKPDGFLYAAGPKIPVIFNTRLSQLCLSACKGTKYTLKAIRKIAAGTYYYNGVASEWAELEFTSQFPGGKYSHMSATAQANGESFKFINILAVTVPETGSTINKIVIPRLYTDVEPAGYTQGSTLTAATSYVTPGDDLHIGPGCYEGAVDNCRINNTFVDSIKDWRFTDCRLKSSFWMDNTINPCEGITFFGNRQAFFYNRWTDSTTTWSDFEDPNGGALIYGATTVPHGDRVLTGPGSTSGWASVELMGSTNDPAKGLSEPKLVMQMPKKGGTTDPDGRPLEFSGIVVHDSGITMEGLPSGSEPPSSLTVGDIWIDTNDDNTIKIKTS